MGWMAILMALLPLLEALLNLFKKTKEGRSIPPAARARLARLQGLMGDVHYHMGRCGIGAGQEGEEDQA